MLSASRSLTQNFKSMPLLPFVPELQAMYEAPVNLKVRQGSVTMIAGRPGSMKSMFAMFWAAGMGLETLYISADMTGFEAAMRMAAMKMRKPIEQIESMPVSEVTPYLRGSNIQFAFEAPITWEAIHEELEAYVEVSNKYPELIIIDNLCDWAGGEFEYGEQFRNMSQISAMARDTGSTVFVLHHTTDGDGREPALPQPLASIKNKLGEKPQQTITVAVDDETMGFRIAAVKQRGSSQNRAADPRRLAFMRADPTTASFTSKIENSGMRVL